MAKYEKSYSNYILRKANSPTKDGPAYENDLRTTTQKFNNVNGNVSYNTNGGFTYVVNNDTYDTKKYNTSGFSYNTYTLSNLNVTEKDIVSKNNISEILSKKYIQLNKYYSDLSKYCYFGSANAMLNAAINDIILNFPAGVNILTGTTGYTLTTNYYLNPLAVDLLNYDNNETQVLVYNIKTLSQTYIDYELVKITTSGETFISDITGFSGINTGSTELTFYLSNENIYSSDIIIRPKENKRNEFFDNLDDLQRDLLNRYSIPKYKSKFKIPKEDGGFEIKDFIWETTDGYNIDVESPNYVIFIKSLIDATNFLDERYNDNLYRMIVHESIKNLENITSFNKDSENYDDVLIAGTKFDKLIRIYGKSFDELKLYIEGISYANSITYDGENNLPKEYLSNNLNMRGWDVSLIQSSIPITAETEERILNHTTQPFSVIDVMTDFTRKLILNSKHIFNAKGTVKSLRKIFGLLGFEESWYECRQFVVQTDNLLTGDTLRNIAELNYTITPDIYNFDDTKSPFEYYFNQDLFSKTNVGIYIKCPYCQSEEYITTGYDQYASGTCDNGHTFLLTDAMVGYPHHTNRSDFYFQQKGSWYKETGGSHVDYSGFTYVNETNTGNNPHIGNGQYDGGYDYISQFSDVFKSYVRNSIEYTQIPLSGYTNIGFDITTKKQNDNTKITYNSSLDTNRKTINLKNFIIGIDFQNMIESLCKNNNTIKSINTSGTTNITLSGDVTPFTYVYGNSEDIVNVYFNFTEDVDFKLIVDQQTCGIILNFDSETLEIDPGSTYYIQYTGSTFNVYPYLFNDEYETVKAITLPYIEQIVPATAIFDFVKIDKNTPKWTLVDQYYEKNIDGTYTGYYVVEYQNTNYFDYYSQSYNDDLINIMTKEFGSGYTFYNNKLFIYEDMEILTEENRDILTENDMPILISTDYGYDNIYRFRKKVNVQDINTNPIWVPINS